MDCVDTFSPHPNRGLGGRFFEKFKIKTYNQIENVLNNNCFELNSDYLKCMDCVDTFSPHPNWGLGGRFFESN